MVQHVVAKETVKFAFVQRTTELNVIRDSKHCIRTADSRTQGLSETVNVAFLQCTPEHKCYRDSKQRTPVHKCH